MEAKETQQELEVSLANGGHDTYAAVILTFCPKKNDLAC